MNSERPLWLLYAWVVVQGGLILLKALDLSVLSWLHTFLPTIIPLCGIVVGAIIGVLAVMLISLTGGKDK